MLVKIDVHAVHIHIHTDASPVTEQILEEIQTMSAQVQRIQDDVTNLTSISQSAIALIVGLAQQVRDNATDPAALNALADQLEASSADLAEAVAANTPSDPAATDAGGTDTGSGGAPDTGGGAPAGDGTTGAAAPAGATDGEGTSALDPTVDPAAGEAATQQQLDNEGGDGSVGTP
jgi:TolA-binding protein